MVSLHPSAHTLLSYLLPHLLCNERLICPLPPLFSTEILSPRFTFSCPLQNEMSPFFEFPWHVLKFILWHFLSLPFFILDEMLMFYSTLKVSWAEIVFLSFLFPIAPVQCLTYNECFESSYGLNFTGDQVVILVFRVTKVRRILPRSNGSS